MNELYDVLKASKASDFLIRKEQTESREAFSSVRSSTWAARKK